MNIAVVGLWHLGTVTAACLATKSNTVTIWDPDALLVEELKRGKLPVDEPGLSALFQEGVESGRLRIATDLTAIREVDLIWICFDTPVDEFDRADTDWVFEQCLAVLQFVRNGALILVSSQLPVGTTRRLEEACAGIRPGSQVSFGYIPENLRLGAALQAFRSPERIVIGLRDAQRKPEVETLLSPYSNQLEWMQVESAEMAKHALNAFLATSVSFINEIATLCERYGADARDVERALKSDIRIGKKAYLRAGGAFAGGTLARDISFLESLGSRTGLPTPLLSGVRRSNDLHKDWPRKRVSELLSARQGNHRVALLGLTYKPGTNTLRRSSAVETAVWLREQGFSVVAFDPAIQHLPEDLEPLLDLQESIEDTLQDASAAIIATEWPEFRNLAAAVFVERMRNPVVLDASGFLAASLGADQRIRYITVGKPA